MSERLNEVDSYFCDRYKQKERVERERFIRGYGQENYERKIHELHLPGNVADAIRNTRW